MRYKQVVYSLVLIYFDNSWHILINLAYNKSKLYKTLDYLSRDILNFDFLEMGLIAFYFLRFWAICAFELFFSEV